MQLYIDYETRSEVELGRDGVGLHNYAIHPSTQILMLAWAIDQEEPQIWFPSEPMPERLLKALHSPNIDLVAFNSPFERYITEYKLGIKIPASRYQDPQASARYLSLPASLEDVGMVLGLPHEMRKDRRGEQLIDLFCIPKTRKKKEGGGIYFNDKITHPKEWEEFCGYAKQDIIAEREVARRLGLLRVYPLPPREREIWLLDQKINDKGMPTDRIFVQKAFEIADKSKKEKLEEQNTLTGLENANSPAQLMPWAQERGYPLSNLRKNNVEIVLKDENVKMTEECRKALEARVEAGSTTYKKLQAILRNLSLDNYLRNQFLFMGSSRCGRWSGATVQLHNLARPDGFFEDLENTIKARNYIYEDNYYNLKSKFLKESNKVRKGENSFYSPLQIVKNLIRTVFSVPQGKRFNVSDLNAIETRVGAWVAQCQLLLDVFIEGKDPYVSFAAKLSGIPYDKIYYDLKKNPDKVARAAAKLIRQISKAAVLGIIYRLGGGDWGHDKNGDKIKTGFWGYSKNYGVDIPKEQAHETVRIFRETYPEICGGGYNGTIKGIWVILEEAVADVLNGIQTIRKVGPEGCIVIDKLNISERNPILRIQLPSGRYLHYMDAAMETVKMPWKQKKEMPIEFDSEGNGTKFELQDVDVYRPAFTYYGKDQTTDQWTLVVSHGGKIFENIVQGIARDVLAEGMLRVDKIGMDICGHVHDEIITLSEDDPFVPGAIEMQKLMSEPMPWAPTLPLGAEGWEDYFYHK